jgi:hypothetical protein
MESLAFFRIMCFSFYYVEKEKEKKKEENVDGTVS